MNNSAARSGDGKPPWPDRLLSYAYAAAFASATGCVLGFWAGFIFGDSREFVATLSAIGFIGGLVTGPVVIHFLGADSQSDPLAASSTGETASESDEAARFAQKADSFLPYAFASALGATLACQGGIGVFVITHGSLGSLAHFCAGGFILGTLAGLTFITIYRGLTGPPIPVPTSSSRSDGPRSARAVV